MKRIFMRYILPILGVAAVVLLDQLVKELCLDKIGMYNTVVLIEDVFELHVIPNKGMAWGMLQNKQWIFVVITPVVLALMTWFYIKLPNEKKFRPMQILTVTLAGGAIGIGEITSIPTAPAIADAYFRLNGEREYHLPLVNTPYAKK